MDAGIKRRAFMRQRWRLWSQSRGDANQLATNSSRLLLRENLAAASSAISSIIITRSFAGYDHNRINCMFRKNFIFLLFKRQDKSSSFMW